MNAQTELKEGQVCYKGDVAQNGKKYIEAVEGSINIGTEVVRYTCSTTRRGGIVIPESFTVIGTIKSVGESFIVSTREGQILDGVDADEAADVRHVRYYIEG